MPGYSDIGTFIPGQITIKSKIEPYRLLKVARLNNAVEQVSGHLFKWPVPENEGVGSGHSPVTAWLIQ